MRNGMDPEIYKDYNISGLIKTLGEIYEYFNSEKNAEQTLNYDYKPVKDVTQYIRSFIIKPRIVQADFEADDFDTTWNLISVLGAEQTVFFLKI